MRNVSTSQLQQCASSNVAGLVGTLLAFCLYCYSLKALPNKPCPVITWQNYNYYKYSSFDCPGEVLEVSWLVLWSPFIVLALENFAEDLSVLLCHPRRRTPGVSSCCCCCTTLGPSSSTDSCPCLLSKHWKQHETHFCEFGYLSYDGRVASAFVSVWNHT